MYGLSAWMRARGLPLRSGALVVIAFLLLGAIGALDLESAEVTERIMLERLAALPFDPSRGDRPWDCDLVGKQWIAWSADGAPWSHACVDAWIRPETLLAR